MITRIEHIVRFCTVCALTLLTVNSSCTTSYMVFPGISGVVRDMDTGEVLNGVEVWETDFWGSHSDSVDCTDENGSYNVTVPGQPEPQTILRYIKTGYLVEHRKAIHSEYLGDYEYRMTDVLMIRLREQSN